MGLTTLLACGGLAPETEDCSGHGLCLPFSGGEFCACDSGWSGVSDVVGTPEQDCQINTDAVFALWILLLCVTLWYFIGYRKHYALMWSVPLSESATLFRKRAAFRSWTGHLTVPIPLFVLCIYKLAHYPDPLPAIGHDIVATVLYSVGAWLIIFTLYNNTWLWQAAVVSANTSVSVGQINSQLRIIKLVGGLSAFFSFSVYFLLFALYKQTEHQVELGAAFWILNGISLFCLSMSELWGISRLLRLIRHAVPADATLPPLFHSLSTWRIAHFGAGMTFITICITIGAWPFARTLGAYTVPISLTTTLFGGMYLVHALPEYTVEVKEVAPGESQATLVMVATSPRARRGSQGTGSLVTPRSTLPPLPKQSSESASVSIDRAAV